LFQKRLFFMVVAVLLRIVLFAIVVVPLGLASKVHAAGPVLYQDCHLTWNANTDSNLGGYRAYFGQIASQLNQVRDVGRQTNVRCSDARVAANGQWYVAITAYNGNGTESAPSQVMQFELTGLVNPIPPPSLSEPTSVHLAVSQAGFQLAWTDANRSPVAHRIEVSSSLQPNWTAAAVLPPDNATFNSYQPIGADWACYRVRGESGPIVSDWAEASGPTDRQFCFTPARVPMLTQPIVASTIIFEPQSVVLIPRQAGFQLTWKDPRAPVSASHRIEISSSTSTGWSSLAVLPTSTTTYTYNLPIDASWVCMRIRTEVGLAVSLWAMAGGPNDRQFCYAPTAISATASATTASGSPMRGAMASSQPASGQTSGQTSESMVASSSVGSSNQPLPTLPIGQSAVSGAISYNSIAEPTAVQKVPLQNGVELRWTDPSIISASHRIEASTSIQPIWTLSSIVPPGVTTFTYNPPIKSEWACLRIRAELQGIASLWAMASKPTDRQFCFRPASPSP
jgi:hypothetical protein